MKLINQSFKVLEQKDFSLVGIKKFIERCGRVCYKSEDRITDTSYETFVNMLERNHHDRPLEFGTVHLKIVGIDMFNSFLDTLLVMNVYNPLWIKYNYCNGIYYITTNYRYYLKIKSLGFLVEFSNKFLTDENNEYYPKRYTVHFITNRAIVDEFRTHIGLSHLAESTRYCNYSKDKFENDITYICPSWMEVPNEVTPRNELCLLGRQYDDTNSANRFLASLVESKYAYFTLLSKGCKPQEARDVLPLSIKSELISCGFEDAWQNFFYRRCANDAHPMARDIAKLLQTKFIESGYVNQ